MGRRKLGRGSNDPQPHALSIERSLRSWCGCGVAVAVLLSAAAVALWLPSGPSGDGAHLLRQARGALPHDPQTALDLLGRHPFRSTEPAVLEASGDAYAARLDHGKALLAHQAAIRLREQGPGSSSHDWVIGCAAVAEDLRNLGKYQPALEWCSLSNLYSC